MAKQIWKPSTLLNPVPVVMVSCADTKGNANIITLAWAGTVNSEPPMLSISVRKERFSYSMIKETGNFVVNLVTKELTFATDFCGVKSGRELDKFKELNLTPEKGSSVNAPIIKESPLNIECVVRNVLELGSHDMFIGEITAVQVDEKYIDEHNKLRLDLAGLICYSHGEYWSLEKSLGYFGYSITKRKNLKRDTLRKK